MTKKEFIEIMRVYSSANLEIMKLYEEFGIDITNSIDENFYNKYNRVIHLLFEQVFTKDQLDALEFWTSDITADYNFDVMYDHLMKIN